MARAVVLAACLCAVGALAAPAAPADGDPASDFLLTQSVFLPFEQGLSARDRLRFAAFVDEVVKAGYAIKVAVIATPLDLGAVPSLYRKPQRYAPFLGQELGLVQRERLLVVMPNGYGFYRYRRPVARERRALAALPAPGTTDARRLTRAAGTAVQRLAALGGVHVAPPTSGDGGGGSRWSARLAIAGIVAAVLGVLGGVALLRRRAAPRAE